MAYYPPNTNTNYITSAHSVDSEAQMRDLMERQARVEDALNEPVNPRITHRELFAKGLLKEIVQKMDMEKSVEKLINKYGFGILDDFVPDAVTMVQKAKLNVTVRGKTVDKVNVIKELRFLNDMSLKEAKQLVDDNWREADE